jgi:spermidine synthase
LGGPLIQGALRPPRPYALELEYTREMMLSLLLRTGPRWPRHVLLIGLGAASLTKFLYRHRPRALLHVVEIEPAVVAAARHFFRLPDDPPRLAIDIGEGAEYLATTDRQFDLILVDGFDAKGRAGMLDMLPFYCNGRARLSEQGLLVTNLLTRSRGVAPSLQRLRAAFDSRVHALPRSDGGNTIALAAVGEPIAIPLGEFRAAARVLKQETGLDLLPTLARMAAQISGGGDRFCL